MTTTAHEDQFTTATQTIERVRAPYDTAAILRRNIASLEVALRTQTERAEAAEAELAKMAQQKPVAWMLECQQWTGDTAWQLSWSQSGVGQCKRIDGDSHERALYANPVPAPAVLAPPTPFQPEDDTRRNDAEFAAQQAATAPSVPVGDDFNGTTPHMIQCIEALVSMNDSGVLAPHGIGSHARTLLIASANRLRQQAAPSVPEEWRDILAWLIEQRGKAGHNHKRPGVWDGDNSAKAGTPCETCAMYDKAHALLQSADHSEQAIEKVAPDCRTCANRGRANWLSQESFCDSCVWQGMSFRKNHFVDAAADRLLEDGE